MLFIRPNFIKTSEGIQIFNLNSLLCFILPYSKFSLLQKRRSRIHFHKNMHYSTFCNLSSSYLKLARRFSLSYRYIDDLISFNNKRFKEFISDIYPKELTISETTESTSVASYLDLLFTRDRSNNITTKLYDKRDAFGFHIVNFPFMSSNIPSAPAYGVYASQLVRYARCCSSYSDF